ncbi:MAG: FtsX-like permease family protein [Candidatus Amulumruptor caecigallinarius]|nr:FtsX-like permease family protein [Candidatus Amulumruptor caecigallinarius]MCM1397629.1 FtsX-like permease family protein [Candidatus Amulumruptor caecigallinarius]MCM1454588.1 FtsX-like permease family protein [bacterium]
MYLSLVIARRMRLRSSGDRGTATGMVIAVSGVALAVVVMMASISVVTGFKREITAKVAGVQSDIVLWYPSGYIADPEPIKEIVGKTLPGATVGSVADMTGILKTHEQYEGLLFRGIGKDYDARFLRSVTTAGSPDLLLTDNTTGTPIMLSEATASALGLTVGDKVDAYFVINGGVRGRRFTVKGTFDTHFANHDKVTAFVRSADVPGFDSTIGEPSASALLVNGIPVEHVAESANRLFEALLAAHAAGEIDDLPELKDVSRTGETYFNWLALLDANVIMILALMGIVAGFTLISSLFIIILRKVRMIGILKAMGATDSMVASIFVIVALRITAIGLLIGDVIGLGLLLAQSRWRFVGLNPESYYLDYVPVDINAGAILLLNVAVAAVAFLVLLAPARLVTTVSPAATMRYE